MTIKHSILAFILFTIPVFGFAQTANDPVICTQQYQPVCALKQVQCVTAPCNPVYQTYGNSCQMSAGKATYVHDGECTGNEPAPGSSNQTYVPPANCVAYYDGCNSCAKQANGAVACTLRACTTQQAGYCTKYATTTSGTKPTSTTVITSTTTVVKSPVPSSVTDMPPAQTEEVHTGFWSRLWNWIKHLFGR
ncbi:MAG: hypothetical protein JWL80_85 [Parcubacteria group bacterium]|nr:hypothetical protein [Parcubacteria group bacterium]